MKVSFDADAYPGRPKILFVGYAESTHTHAWVDLLEGAEFNVRLFGLPTGVPPDDWWVKTYVTAPVASSANPDARARLYPISPRRRAANLLRRSLPKGLARPLLGDAEVPEHRWLAEVIRGWRPDVVHTLGLEPAAYFYLEARRRFGLEAAGKWVVQARGGPELSLKRLLPEQAALIRAVLEECDQFVADNPLNYEYALGLGLRRECLSPLGVVPGTGGIDVDGLARDWGGPPSRRRLILWPKAYDCPQSKALPVFEALKLAWGRIRPCEVHMLVVTPEARMWFQTLPEEIRAACHLDDRIPRGRVIELMKQSRVMLAPSLSDGVPNSMYEAMAAGAFPVVSPLDTIRPLVEHERNVLFARNLYPQEVADALTRAMNDDGLVDAAAERNLELVRRAADRAEIRARILDFYERLAVA